MDTISSRENSNILPMAGVIIGAGALLLSIVAFFMVKSANTKVADLEVNKIPALESQVSTASQAAEKANTFAEKVRLSTQDAVTQLSTMIGDTNGRVTKLEEAQKAKPVATTTKGGKATGEPAVAGPGEYIVKKGDIGTTIAKANGCSVADLVAVNPGVSFNKLAVGQKLKLPAKK
jgi:LysM repeat protein